MFGRSVFVSVLLLVSAACGGAKTSPSSPMTSSPSPTEATLPNSIDVRDYSYYPRTTTVKAGSTVTWTQTGAAPHNVTSTKKLFVSSPNCAHKGDVPYYKQSTGCMKQGDAFSFTFMTSGTYYYYCTLHSLYQASNGEVNPDHMGGVIYVR